MTAESDENEGLSEAFRGLDLAAGGADDIRRTVLNQRDQLIGAEAELGTARRELARLEKENALLRMALYRAQRWPFGWIRSLVRVTRVVLRRLSRAAS